MLAMATAVRVITLRFAIPVVTLVLLSAFTPADLEKAKSAKDYFEGNYWKCLATEILQKEQTNMSIQDISVGTPPTTMGYGPTGL